jgi:hypothetical protein
MCGGGKRVGDDEGLVVVSSVVVGGDGVGVWGVAVVVVMVIVGISCRYMKSDLTYLKFSSG